MFSAFSFGSVIKTILPGTILSVAMVMILEALWLFLAGESLIVQLISSEWLTVSTAALVPLSLILGFLLNTLVWLTINKRLRAERDAKLSGTVFPELRRRLSAQLWDEIRQHLGDRGETPGQVSYPSRESLEYFYLPIISLSSLNYLWESYFSWYEFQINTACAVLALDLSSLALLWVLWSQIWQLSYAPFPIAALFVAFVGFGLCWGLKHAAVENLTEYERSLMLLVTGSLSAAAKRPAASAEDGMKG